MQLYNFSGGLLTRVAPSLIKAEYSVVNINTNLLKGPLQPEKAIGTLGASIAKYAAWFNNAWKDFTAETSWLIYRQNLYYTNADGAKKVLSTGEEYSLGIAKPVAAPTIAAGSTGPLTGTYQYTYTYYNSKDGTESNPAEYSSQLAVSSKAITVTLVASTDTQVDLIRVYRIGGNQLSFTLVEEVPNTTTTYTDDTADVDVEGTLLLSLDYGTPPVRLKYLSEFAGTFFGAVDDKLYFTEPLGNPNYWPETNYVRLPSNVTGIAITANGIVVFAQYTSYVITGTDSTTFVLLLLSTDQGCTSHQSIARFKSGVLFTSTDGLCYTDGSSVELMSYQTLGKLNLVPTHAVIHDRTYYAIANGLVFRWDGLIDAYSYLDLGVDALYSANDVIYGRKDGKLGELFVGTPLTYTYKTPVLTEGLYSNLKTYNTVYIRADGEFRVKIYLDPQGLVVDKTYSGNATHEIAIPQADMQGYAIQFELSGTAIIYEIEYKVVGRQNGI